MFRLYFTVILGCCLLAAQPTMSHAARSTSQKTLQSMLSKKKKRHAIYIAVGSTVLMAVAVGAGVLLYKTRRRSQSVHPNGSDARPADEENPEERLVIPTLPVQGTKLADTTHSSPGLIPRVWTGPPVPSDSPPGLPQSLGNADYLTTPYRRPVSMKTPESDPLNEGRIEQTPTNAGCGSTGDTPQSSPAKKNKFTRNKQWYLTLSLGADYATNDNNFHRYPNRGNLLTFFEPTNPSNEEQSLHEMKLALELLNPTYQSPLSTKSTQSLHLLLGLQRQQTPFHRDQSPGTPGDPEE